MENMTKMLKTEKTKDWGKSMKSCKYYNLCFLENTTLKWPSSLFLSSTLLNCEAWVNLSEQNIRSLEQTDEMLLSKILNCDSNSSNVHKYLELGIYPIRFEIM